ncbi:MBL fold metallo-hydrolase [uncultured Bacteroides sp.]|uniref:ComEC/Rec2 family competence protein n=1 Tax=uncultured Bacteroides sp. TaxID=162156 RepID=UPI00261EB042|nr:MBL fold metallo-hydrolase [uncultured Bacteroides sp.]
MKYLLFNIIFASCFIQMVYSQNVPSWKEGYLDIHHINTGRGNATFIVFPDGTTMLIDAGDNNRIDERSVEPKPNNEITVAECIVDYIKYFMPQKHKNNIDYCLITHFHSDHLGAVFKNKVSEGDYYLTGITEVHHLLPILSLVDRGYQYMCPDEANRTFSNYKKFVNYVTSYDSVKRESFNVGSSRQFALKYLFDKYNTIFKVQNIYANGQLWISNRHEKCSLFPEIKTLAKDNMLRENMLSCVLKLRYGNFSYYTGGDIPGYPGIGKATWHDVESLVAQEVGHVEVAVLNHHGYEDTTNENFVSILSPQVFIAHTWNAAHLNHSVLNRMLSKSLYSYDRDIYVTNVHLAAKIVTGNLINRLKSMQGHIMVRVEKGGDRYWVFVLDDSIFGSYNLLLKSGPYECKCRE